MTLIFIVLLLIQLFYWHYFYGNLSKETEIEPPNSLNDEVSILICAKNEIDNLKKNLPEILKQTHRKYRVIVADDFSSDGTTEFLKQIDKEKRILTSFKVTENKHGKKAALAQAIALSNSNWILLTDADCHPMSGDWVASMISRINTPEKSLVLGYSPYEKGASCVSKWTHFEAWITALQYLSYAKRGIPYMGVGRNLLYRKDLVTKKVLNKYEHLASGDDDLTVMQVANANNTAINLDPRSFVRTSAPSSFSAYWQQKRRHFSTATSYLWKHKILLSLYSVSQILFFPLLLFLCLNHQVIPALIIYAVRLVLITPVIVKLRNTLEADFSLFCFPIYDLAQGFYYMIFSFVALFPQKTRW